MRRKPVRVPLSVAQAIALAPSIADALDQRPPRGSKYQPHQGAWEKARRLRARPRVNIVTTRTGIVREIGHEWIEKMQFID